MQDNSENNPVPFLPPNLKSVDLPTEFKSEVSGTQFEKCISCDNSFIDTGKFYIVEKAYKNYIDFNARELIFEYAICFDCYKNLSSSFSKQSMQKMMDYYEKNLNMEARIFSFYSQQNFSLDDWLGKCVLKNKPVKEYQEYQISGFCCDDKMLFYHMPMAIGSEAIEDMVALLSLETLDEISGFIDDHFDCPPSIKKILRDKKTSPALI